MSDTQNRMTSVGRIRRSLVFPVVLPENSVYIGRACYGYPESPFHNPFHVGRDGNRGEVLKKFTEYWYADAQSKLRLRAIKELKDKTLLCWCHPLKCHGDIIRDYVLFSDWTHHER